MTIGLEHYLVLGALLFCIGFFIALSKKNAVGVLIGVELMLNAVNLTLVAFSRFGSAEVALSTQVFVVFIIAVAAAEVGGWVGAGVGRLSQPADHLGRPDDVVEGLTRYVGSADDRAEPLRRRDVARACCSRRAYRCGSWSSRIGRTRGISRP